MSRENAPYIKHTLGECHFYRRDDTITLEIPPERYNKCKEEDGENEEWFDKIYQSHNINKKSWLE